MSRSAMILLLSVVWVMACRHTQETEKGDTGGEKQAKQETPKPQKRVKARRDSEVKRPAYPGRPELSTNATGLMTADGPMKIQKALADQGYFHGEVTGKLDEETASAIRKFQGDLNLARTGVPDRETVKKLGLSEADVWRDQQKREKVEQKQREEQHEEKKAEEPRS
jgi:peptidoglycan hydrolase-like protein with peptidoglycan-binding domain